MKTLGLDIGTTTISAVVYDNVQGVIDARTVKNDSFLSAESWARLQNPELIYHRAMDSVHALLKAHPDIAAIGLTGQMHGILYLNQDGSPVSPLYTWQDGRGDLPYDEAYSWACYLAETTGYAVATGYGLVTHFYNLHHDLVPTDASCFCTIHDYIAMKLSGRTAPLIDPTDAASFGVYDGPNSRFDLEALAKVGINPSILPQIAASPYLGTGAAGIPVYVGIGDNQASFLGTTKGRTDVLLVNVGTGSQISVYSPTYLEADTLETRPFPDGGWLLVGASLCGGRSYAILENFFRETVKMVTGNDVSAYDAMALQLEKVSAPDDTPTVTTTFQGTRKQPHLKGSITGLDIHNFTPAHLLHGFMQGMANELYDMYSGYLSKGGAAPSIIYGSGNGLRKNPYLCATFEKIFGCSVILSQNNEEAASGAAIYAAKHQAQH